MSKLNKHKKKIEEKSPSGLLKRGIDSIIFLFENKNNEFSKKIDENQIIIANLEKKNKKLIKENYILRKNNNRQNKIIEELRNENLDLKNIINNIKGKLNIDLNILKNNSKAKLDKLNLNNFGNIKRTRNFLHLGRHISSLSNKDIYLTNTERYHRKNFVLDKNIKKEKNISLKENGDSNLASSEYLFNIKDNYYTRQRSKNNSFNKNFFNNENSPNAKLLLNKIEKKNIFNYNSYNFRKKNNNIHLINDISKDYNILKTYQTIDFNDRDASYFKFDCITPKINYNEIRVNKQKILFNNILKK